MGGNRHDMEQVPTAQEENEQICYMAAKMLCFIS
jgi:hypothetical protein